jgi:hypothetical protein
VRDWKGRTSSAAGNSRDKIEIDLNAMATSADMSAERFQASSASIYDSEDSLDDLGGGDPFEARSRSRSGSPFAHLSRRPPELLSSDTWIEDGLSGDAAELPHPSFSPELVANRAYRANTRRSTAASSLATNNEAFGDADRTRMSQQAAAIRSARTALQTLRPVPATVADLSVGPSVTSRFSSASGNIVDAEWIDPSLAQVRRE